MNLITLQIIITIIAISGAILNVYKNRICFPLWILANGLCILLYLKTKLYIIIIIQICYICINIIGWIKWKTCENIK